MGDLHMRNELTTKPSSWVGWNSRNRLLDSSFIYLDTCRWWCTSMLSSSEIWNTWNFLTFFFPSNSPFCFLFSNFVSVLYCIVLFLLFVNIFTRLTKINEIPHKTRIWHRPNKYNKKSYHKMRSKTSTRGVTFFLNFPSFMISCTEGLKYQMNEVLHY